MAFFITDHLGYDRQTDILFDVYIYIVIQNGLQCT